MEDFPDVDAYLEASEQWPEEIRALRPLLVSAGLDETIKWGKPCYTHGDANIAIVQEFADNLALMFFKGILLDDPAGLLEEVGPNSHAARRMMFTSVKDVETHADAVAEYVQQAIAVEDAGTEVPPRPDEELAPELAERLAGDPELAASFDGLTPGRQRAYNLHVSAAKQSTTRERRVDKIVPRILEGRGLSDR
ncbi:YdeI family protein [Egicoccus sp. AB-alg2]|uniref:YdeI/OmpD-associated family protein n=1 Tax=Egicoccus sp. AB-alg2 TaxID=3242693 RepID=UPI00359D9CE9